MNVASTRYLSEFSCSIRASIFLFSSSTFCSKSWLLSLTIASTKIEFTNDNPMILHSTNSMLKYSRTQRAVTIVEPSAMVSGISFHPSPVQILNIE